MSALEQMRLFPLNLPVEDKSLMTTLISMNQEREAKLVLTKVAASQIDLTDILTQAASVETG